MPKADLFFKTLFSALLLALFATFSIMSTRPSWLVWAANAALAFGCVVEVWLYDYRRTLAVSVMLCCLISAGALFLLNFRLS